MHICFVTKNNDISKTSFEDYGQILPTARHLARLGHTIQIITWKAQIPDKSTYEEEHIVVHFLAVGQFRSIQEFPDLTLKKLEEIQKKQPIDIVHSFDTPFKNFKKVFPKKPFALSFGVECTSMMDVFNKFSNSHTSDLSALLSVITSSLWFLKKYFLEDYFLLKQADGILVSSPRQTLALDRYYLYAMTRTYQIPLSLASGFFPKKEKNLKLMEKLSLDPNSQIVIARDSFHDFKQTEFLLYAFSKVAIKKPRSKLLIIGDGPEFKKAERTCIELALDNRVLFLGKLSKKVYMDYINLGDIFIHLSGHTSGLGVALLEAMSQEKIVIGSEFSPISNFITDHENGLLIRPGESDTLVKLIIDILENPQKFQEFGRQARAKVIETLDRKKLALTTSHAFENIVRLKQKSFWRFF